MSTHNFGLYTTLEHIKLTLTAQVVQLKPGDEAGIC